MGLKFKDTETWAPLPKGSNIAEFIGISKSLPSINQKTIKIGHLLFMRTIVVRLLENLLRPFLVTNLIIYQCVHVVTKVFRSLKTQWKQKLGSSSFKTCQRPELRVHVFTSSLSCAPCRGFVTPKLLHTHPASPHTFSSLHHYPMVLEN